MSDSGTQQKSGRDRQTPDSGFIGRVPESTENTSAAHMHTEHVSRKLGFLSDRIEKLAVSMEKGQLHDYLQLAVHPWTLIWRNLLYGTVRGIGIAIGFTFFAATIVWVLQTLGKLNLPIVGDFIADIVRIVQRQMQIKPY